MTTAHALLKQEHAHAEKVKELTRERDALRQVLDDLVEATEWLHEVRRVHEWMNESRAWQEPSRHGYGEICGIDSNAQQTFLVALQRAKDVDVA
jgi:hypothetical protein